MITREAFIDQFMTEVIDELEQMAYPLISAGVTGIDVEDLSMRALNIVRARYGYPPTTERHSPLRTLTSEGKGGLCRLLGC